MSRSPYPITTNDIIKHQIMESKSNYYHIKNDDNNWNLIKQIIKRYSVSYKEKGYFLSDCIGSTYNIEDIYNNMNGLMLIFNTDYHDQIKNTKKRKINNLKDNSISPEEDIDNENKFQNNIFNSYQELPDFMFRKNHAQYFLQNFKLPSENSKLPWPFTIYLFSGDSVYYSDGYNGKKGGDFIFCKSINNQPIIFTNFINQLC